MMGRVRNLVRPLYWKIAERLPLRARRHYLYSIGLRRLGNFDEPRSFNEKVNWRILHDRREQIVSACDKLAMKETVIRAFPDGSVRVPETYWHGVSLADAPDLDGLPPWVLKPNNGSGHVAFGPRDRGSLLEEVSKWRFDRPYAQLGEWGYGQARSLLVLEERIGGNASVPADCKFFVFDGTPRLIQLNSDRFGERFEWLLEPTWRPVGARDLRLRQVDLPPPPPPRNLDRMLEVAASLGQGWDFIRVDLYSVDGDVWFGELSPYPGGGVTKFHPASFDYSLGAYWNLPQNLS